MSKKIGFKQRTARAAGSSQHQSAQSPKRQMMTHIAAWLDNTPAGEQISFFEPKAVSKHIAWRIAHYFDSVRAGDERAEALSFVRFMGQNGFQPIFYWAGNTKIGYKFNSFMEAALPALAVGEQAGYEVLAAEIPDLADYAKRNLDAEPFVRLLPAAGDVFEGQEAWFYKPEALDLAANDKAIQAAKTTGLAKAYLGAGKDDVVAVELQALGFNTRTKNWDRREYSKTFTPTNTSLQGWKKSGQDDASQFAFKPLSASGIDDYLEKIYSGGGFTIPGKPLFYTPSRGRRIKEQKPDEIGANAKKKRIPRPLEYALQNAFGADRVEALLGQHARPAQTVDLPTILPQKTRVMAIDVDDIQLKGQHDISSPDGLQGAWGEVRERLPEALRDARTTMVLSASAGMKNHPEDPDLKVFDPVTNTLRCRLWFELDEPMDPEEFGKYIVQAAPDLKADDAIYRANQPNFGAPQFVADDDPLGGARKTIFDGDPKVSLKLIEADIEALEEARIKEEQEQAASNPKRKAPTSPARSQVSINSPRLMTTEHRNLESLSPILRAAAVKLSCLGDRQAMRETLGVSNHYEFTRRIVNGVVNAVFEDDPMSSTMTTLEAANPRGDSLLATNIRALNALAVQSFVAAAHNPAKETTPDHLIEYGLQGGVEPNGKYAQLVAGSTVLVHQKVHTKMQSLSQRLRAAARLGQPAKAEDIQSYLENYCNPTTAAQIRHELYTDQLLATDSQCIYFADPNLAENARVASVDPANRKMLIGAIMEKKSVSALPDLDVVTNLEDLDDGHGNMRPNAIFAPGYTPEEALEAVRELKVVEVKLRRMTGSPFAPRLKKKPEASNRLSARRKQMLGRLGRSPRM